MNDRQENKVRMYHALKELCDLNSGIWRGDAPFSASYALFLQQLSIIDAQKAIQTTNTTGVAIDKRNKRLILEDQIFYVANRIRSYASATNNETLRASINYSRSSLTRAREAQLFSIARLVKNLGMSNLSSLGAYGITNNILNNLEIVTTNFQNVVQGPSAAKTAPVAATKALTAAIVSASSIINSRLDVDVEVFKARNLTFYNQYKSARETIDFGSNTRAMRCIVQDTYGHPLPNVIAVIAPVSIIKKTSAKGTFQINHLAAGTYTIMLTKFGFVTKTEIININIGKTTTLTVVLAVA